MTYHTTPPPAGGKKNRKIVVALGFLVFALLMLFCAGAVANFGDNAKADRATAINLPDDSLVAIVPSATIATRPAPAPSPTTFGAGDYEVGAKLDLRGLMLTAGTYAVATDSHCYWERLRGFSGEFNDIITNGNLDAGQVVRVTVKRSDKGFRLEGDCVAKRLK